MKPSKKAERTKDIISICLDCFVEKGLTVTTTTDLCNANNLQNGGIYYYFDTKEKMEEYKENFRNRDDVIKFCKEHYGSEWKTYRERIIENYVTRGITNFDEIKQCIKYSNKVSKETTKEITNKKNYLNDKQKKKVLEAKQDEEDAVAISILLQKKIRKKKNISSITYDKEKEKESATRENIQKDDESIRIDSIKKANRIDKVKHSIKIIKAYLSAPNSAGGVDAHFIWKNVSDKTIKYLTWSGYPINAVGDPVD